MLQALDLDELGVMPFDAEAFTTLVQPAANSMNGRESLDDLRRWYDMGFIGVSQEGRSHPEGYEAATTAELMAYWMGQSDAAGGSPRSCPG